MAAFRHLSTHIVPPRSNVREARLNTNGQKFEPESLYEPVMHTERPALCSTRLARQSESRTRAGLSVVIVTNFLSFRIVL